MPTDADYARRIAALIAKAERTDSPEEAEAFFAGAQRLMTQYRISEAELAGARETDDNPIDHELFRLEFPYADARAHVLFAVAQHNDVRLVLEGRNVAHLIGFRRDIERVLMLYSALNMHAAREMTRENIGNAQAYRRSFMISFGRRISERLEEAKLASQAEAAGTLPVLYDRSKLVDDRAAEIFPHTRTKRARVTSGAGAAAGRAAANNADLGQSRIGGQGEIR